MYATKRTEYKGYPVLAIVQDGRPLPTIRFGLRKAKAILAVVPEIEHFVEENDGEKGEEK